MGLDQKLHPLLEILRESESKHEIVTLLTADHGFTDQVRYFLNLESVLPKKSKVLNENRMAAVYLEDSTSKDYVSQELLKFKGIQLVGVKTSNGFTIASDSKKLSVLVSDSAVCSGQHHDDGLQISTDGGLSWSCLSAVNSNPDPFGYPFFLTNLSHYFRAANAPDLAVIPDRFTAFSNEYVGFHGGPTEQETLVPLLLRNASMSSGNALPLWRLMSDVFKETSH